MKLGRRPGLAGARQGRWYVRVVRGLRPDRNPLRRRSDRMQTCLLAGFFVVAAAGAPFAALAASHASYEQALRVEQAQVAAEHQVRATLTQAAQTTVNLNVVSAAVPVEAAWTSVTGVRHTGLVLASAGSPLESSVTVWTDAAGNLTSPPLLPSQVAGQADLAGIGAVAGVGSLYLCLALVVRHVLDRRRMAAWEADWLVTAREWNRQR